MLTLGHVRGVPSLLVLLVSLVGCGSSMAQGISAKTHPVRGIVLRVDGAHRSMEVSCDEIPDYMSAMDMLFRLRDAKDAEAIRPGAKVRFTMVEEGKALYAEHIEIETVAVLEPEPIEANGLAALHKALNPALAAKQVAIGQMAPDFVLTDQAGEEIRLSQFQGKVVALTFGYSRCPNPNYCYRLSNNLAAVQRQLQSRAGKDFVLLTIAIDPEHDQGEVLKEYAKAFHADPAVWHFLTGRPEEIHRVASMFGMDFWSNDGLITHTLHTVVLDRSGQLAANLEGNQFTAKQLADLVRSVMDRPR